MTRVPFLTFLSGLLLGVAVTSITQEQIERRWSRRDIEDALALNLMQEIAPGEFGADLPVTRGELARILLEARPYLRALQGPPGPPGPPGPVAEAPPAPVLGAPAARPRPGRGEIVIRRLDKLPLAQGWRLWPGDVKVAADGTLWGEFDDEEAYVTPLGVVLAPNGTAFSSQAVYEESLKPGGGKILEGLLAPRIEDTRRPRDYRYQTGMDEELLRLGAAARIPGGIYFQSLEDYRDFVAWHNHHWSREWDRERKMDW